MNLHLKNIGKLEEASVEINGITVIAGENNTGKSTVGKTLFAIFNSLYNIEEKIEKERIDTVRQQLYHAHRNIPSRRISLRERHQRLIELSQMIVSSYEEWETAEIPAKIYDVLIGQDESFCQMEKSDLDELVAGIQESLRVTEIEIARRIVQRKINAEFNDQINNVYTEDGKGHISLSVKNMSVNVCVENDKVVNISELVTLGTEAIYIDDPFVLDEKEADDLYGEFNSRLALYGDHRSHLKSKMDLDPQHSNIVDEIIIDAKFEHIYKTIAAVCKGNIVKNQRGLMGYRLNDSEKILNVKNLSTGLKTFAILKLLLTNGSIQRNGTLILDEPEIHLHPEWQLIFAELIVLLHKVFGLHILMNTHSPYFLNAIEVYAEKYNEYDSCKFYLAEEIDGKSQIKDVSHNIEEIYLKLARPLQTLENERYADD